MRLTTFHCACVALALASPAMAQQSAVATSWGAAQDGRRVGNPADAGHDPRSWATGRRQQARRGGGQYRDRLADQPAGQCLVRPRPIDVDHPDRQGLSDGALLFRPHRAAVADRMGHQLQSGRPGQQRRIATRGLREERARRSRAPGSIVCTPTVGSNVLQVAAASLQPRGGLLVTLKGAPKPISFMLVAGGGAYDADLTVQVADRGPNAKGVATGPAAPDTASPFLTAMLDGAPPAEAEPLAVAGVSPDDLRAWKVGDRVVLRTRFALISPEWLASQTGEGGVTVYSLPVTPVVLLSQDGVTISASLSEP